MFEKYAKVNEFDPLLPNNWYAQSRKKVLSNKVLNISSFFLSHFSNLFASLFLLQDALSIVKNNYKNNLSKALVDLFPEVGFDRIKFWDSMFT